MTVEMIVDGTHLESRKREARPLPLMRHQNGGRGQAPPVMRALEIAASTLSSKYSCIYLAESLIAYEYSKLHGRVRQRTSAYVSIDDHQHGRRVLIDRL